MEKLKEMLQKSLKIHPKTLTKINKQLNNNTQNNNTINNIYVQLGRENLSEILSSKEIFLSSSMELFEIKINKFKSDPIIKLLLMLIKKD
jgi:ABC-type Fe2+-enterobactin transport system substrate-binding protein